MSKYIIKNDKCHKLFFRAWRWAKDRKSKIYPKKAKAFPMLEEVDCHFCGCC